MKKQLLQLQLLIFTSAIAFAQPNNVNVSNNTTTARAGEPYLAVNPTNPKNIVIAWMAIDPSTGFVQSIKSKASFDGGLTWGNQKVHPHFGTTWHSGDVNMQFRNNGTLYLNYIDFTMPPALDSGGLYITHSTNGGITWSSPTQVVDIITDAPGETVLDRPWLAVDNSGTANDGMFYITTMPAFWNPLPNRSYLKTSIDSGASWSAFRYVDTTGYLVGSSIQMALSSPAVTADGALCIAYLSYVPSQSVYPKILFAKSYNRGASFQYYGLLVNPQGAPGDDYKEAFHLAANPANANQLALVRTGNENGDPDIFIISTNDGGANWNTMVLVNDDASGKSQDMVWASYAANGDLVVTWRDRRNGTGTGINQSSDTYCAISHNNGATFEPNFPLSNVTATYDTILLDGGNDFMACELVNDTIYAAWGDVRIPGKIQIYFAKISASTGITTGITAINPEDQQMLNISPNPASDKLFISIQNKELKQIEVKIFSESGQEIISKIISTNLPQTSLNISQLATGIYIVQAVADKQTVYNQKIVITK